MATLLKITFEYLIYTIVIVSSPSVIRKSEPQYIQVIEETEDSYICGPVKNY